eukprot:SAG31_NODE_496_length_14862_cov_9.280837_10_plen_64_part_00
MPIANGDFFLKKTTTNVHRLVLNLVTATRGGVRLRVALGLPRIIFSTTSSTAVHSHSDVPVPN